MDVFSEYNLDYQTEAVNAVVNLFKYQPIVPQYFVISNYLDNDCCIGNNINISNEDILDNLRFVQMYNKIPINEKLTSLNFNIEMDTGIGNTYVYLKTIFELNKQYAFIKFIIIVKNKYQLNKVYNFIVATEEHFKSLYDNIIYEYFIYDSSKLEQVRNFAVNSNIQIMIINIDSFNSKNNIIYKRQDNGHIFMDFIAKTNPILIIDNSEELSDKTKNAINNFNPLFTLNYSSISSNNENLIYRLDYLDVIK